MTDPEVKVPGVGKMKKNYAIAGAAVIGLAGIMYYRSHKASSSSSATTSTTSSSSDPYPPDGTSGNPTDPNSVDPTTGITYGDEQASGTSYSPGYNSYDASTGTTGGSGTSVNSGPGSFTDNASWSQYAEAYLTGTMNMDPATAGNALGLYLNGQPMTSAQKQIVDDAIAIAGQPPVSGPNGFPPAIHQKADVPKPVSHSPVTTKPVSHSPVTTKPVSHTPVTTKPVSTHPITGKPIVHSPVYPANPVRGLHDHVIQHRVYVQWDKEPDATGYTVELFHKGKRLHTGHVGAHTNYYRFHNLKPREYYTVTVLAKPAKHGAHAAHVSFNAK